MREAHATKMLEGLHVPGEERFLFLAREGHDKAASGMAQVHNKDLYLLSDPSNDGDGFPPIDLRILAGSSSHLVNR